jgi:hypothetical protein
MKRLAILAIVAGCAAPGLRGDYAPSTIQLVDQPRGAR